MSLPRQASSSRRAIQAQLLSQSQTSSATSPYQSHQHPLQHQQLHATSPTDSFFSMDEGTSENQRLKRQPHIHLHPPGQEPSFSFVCLGTGGGPLEGDCSCYLMKPADSSWQEGSIAVEGGSWLGALTSVLEQTGPDSAFYDFDFPYSTPTAHLRAGLVASTAEAFLISHAHLDHILGLVLGSGSLPGQRSVYGLRSTLDNLLNMFNGTIWPTLAGWDADEPTTRLHLQSLEPQRPYNLNSSLSVLPFPLSHGLNPSVPPAPPTPSYTPAKFTQGYFSKRASLPLSTQMASFRLARGVDERAQAVNKTVAGAPQAHEVNTRRGLKATLEDDKPELPFGSPFASTAEGHPGAAPKHGEPVSPRASPARASGSSTSSSAASTSSAPVSRDRRSARPRTAQGSETHAPPPSAWTTSSNHVESLEPKPSERSGAATLAPPAPNRPPRRATVDRTPSSLDSTAFFITHNSHNRDVLFFGDVEPDGVSQSPRNRHVWRHAAERFVEGRLNAVFLECSFPKGHPIEFLYGHLSVEYLFEELKVLAIMVKRLRDRRRGSGGGSPSSRYGRTNGSSANHLGTPTPTSDAWSQCSVPPSPLGTSSISTSPHVGGLGDNSFSGISDEEVKGQLQGLGIIIIHVKPALFPTFTTAPDDDDSSPASLSSSYSSSEEKSERHRKTTEKLDARSMPVRILDELNEEESQLGLGVRFVMAQQGMRIEC